VRGRSFRVSLRLLAPVLVCLVAGGSIASPPGTEAEPADAAALRPLIHDARWAEAETAARALVAQRAAAYGEDSPEYAAALELLLEVLVRSGRWSEPKTRELAARAVAINEKTLPPDAPALATSLIRLGGIERLVGPFDHARAILERALAIREAAFGANSLPVAEALAQLGWSMIDTPDPQQAIAMHERALAIRESILGKDDLLVAVSLAGLGGVARNAGDFQKAEAAHERALDIRRRHLRADHPDIALSILSVADAKHRLGDLGGALPLYEEALTLREHEPTPDLPRLSEALLNLGDLLTDLGSLDRARPMYERGVRIRDETIGDGSFITGIGHQSYALFLEAAGDAAGARREFERAIAIFDGATEPGHPLRAVGRQDLGLMLKRQGDLDAAREMLQASLDIWRMAPAGRPGHPFSAVPMIALGSILRDRGDVAAAGPLLDQAVAILEASYGPAHPRYAEALLERSRLAFREGNDDAALEDALRAEESLRINLRATTRALSESEALRYQEVMISGLDTAFSILLDAGDPPDASTHARTVFEALGRSRTLVLDEIAARHRSITRSDDPKIRSLDEALVAALRNYARLVVEGPSQRSPAGYAPRLQGAREAMERAERGLAAASRAFADARERQNMTYAAIAKTLPEASALVSFVAYTRSDRAAGKGKPSYLACVVAPGAAAPAVVPLGAAAGIDAAIDRWRKESSTPPAGAAAEESYRLAAAAVREALWDPLAGRLGSARRVFIVPDAAIHALSFATLVDRGGKYLMETGPEFHYVSSERDLLEGAGGPVRGSGLLALGGPDFDAAAKPGKTGSPQGSQAGPPGNVSPTVPVRPGIRLRGPDGPCADFDALTFSPLPGSAAEVRRVQELWGASGDRARGGPVKVLTGREASEANLSRAAVGKKVLHLATHAFFVPSRCEERITAGAVAPKAGVTGGRLQAGTPLRISGLALSGANRRASARSADDDGLLTAEEISSLDLDGVEWVVLSGCQTGIGLARAGEGILGLRRSFQVAGARTLVLSLWPVSDNDTQSWMAELYRARSRGATTSDAVTAASRRIVEARRKAGVTVHPFFWGAFVAAGDWH